MTVAAIVQSNSANSTGTASPTIVLGSAPTAGNTLLAIMASDTTTTAAPTAGTGNNYTNRLTVVGNQGWYVDTRLVVAGDSATTTFHITGSNPASLMVFEISGTYDKIGTNAHTVNTPGTVSRTATTLTPASVDNLVFAIAGLHNLAAGTTAASSNNTFTIARTQAGTTGATIGSVIAATRATGATSATGTTTLSWTGGCSNSDGVQIAFTGLAAAGYPFELLTPTPRYY